MGTGDDFEEELVAMFPEIHFFSCRYRKKYPNDNKQISCTVKSAI